MKTKKTKELTQQQQTGFGVVGTWVSPNKLGGTLPLYISDTKKSALMEANTNQRLFEFLDMTEQWLCEITITPIKKVEAKKQFTD